MPEKITSKDNPHFKQYIRLCSSAKARRECSMFAIEGLRLCTDALKSGLKPEVVFYTSEWKNNPLFQPIFEAGTLVYEISDSLAVRMADTKSPQGIFCIGRMLDKFGYLNTIKRNGIYLAMEDLADPGNLGTVLRTAEAFGANGVILNDGCCDEYAPKVLRGSMGAVFRLPIFHVESLVSFISEQVADGIPVYASVPDRSARSILDTDFSGGGVMLIGNEANGLRAETIHAASCKVTIPMSGNAESLNAAIAASILIWQMNVGRNT